MAKLERVLSIQRDFVKGRVCILELVDKNFLASKYSLVF